MANNLTVLTGNWYDDDGFLIECGVKFALFQLSDGRFEDGSHIIWERDENGNLVSDQCVAYFSPNGCAAVTVK